MKTIKLSATLSETINYRQAFLAKVESACPTCGVGSIPQRIYGTLFLPKQLGIPDQIVIKILKKGEKG